jgi:hypothetical protein
MFNDMTGVIATVLHGELLMLWVIVALITCFSHETHSLAAKVRGLPAEPSLMTA